MAPFRTVLGTRAFHEPGYVRTGTRVIRRGRAGRRPQVLKPYIGTDLKSPPRSRCRRR
jgi:hypothetical protein